MPVPISTTQQQAQRAAERSFAVVRTVRESDSRDESQDGPGSGHRPARGRTRGTRTRRYLGQLRKGDGFECGVAAGFVEGRAGEAVAVNVEGRHLVWPPRLVVEVVR